MNLWWTGPAREVERESRSQTGGMATRAASSRASSRASCPHNRRPKPLCRNGAAAVVGGECGRHETGGALLCHERGAPADEAVKVAGGQLRRACAESTAKGTGARARARVRMGLR